MGTLYLLSACLLLGSPTPDKTLIIKIGDTIDANLEKGLQSFQQERVEFVYLPIRELLEQEMGFAFDEKVTDASLKKLFDDARNLEQTTFGKEKEIQALREQIIEGYQRILWPSRDSFRVIASTSLDIAAATFSEGKEEFASRLALQALIDFDDPKIDRDYYNPSVQELFSDVRNQLTDRKRSTVEVMSPSPGRVFYMGQEIGSVNAAIAMPQGKHRVWSALNEKRSLPRLIKVQDGLKMVNLDADLECRILLGEKVSFQCEDNCPKYLSALGSWLKVDRVVGIASIGDSSSFTVFQVEIKNNRFTKYTYLPGTRYEVLSDPWYKVPMNYSPFGLAQLNQGRVLPAVAVALLQVGTLGWHLQAVSSHQSALEDRTLTQSDREGALAMRNVSAGLFYTAILAGVAEALIVDWLDDSEPVEDSTIFPW